MQLLITFDPLIIFVTRACHISLQLHRFSVQDLETRNLILIIFGPYPQPTNHHLRNVLVSKFHFRPAQPDFG